jgi:hypothetical protein
MSVLHSNSTLLANNILREAVADLFWSWFDLHRNDVVLERKVFIFPLRVHVRDLEGLFQRLFGVRGEADV